MAGIEFLDVNGGVDGDVDGGVDGSALTEHPRQPSHQPIQPIQPLQHPAAIRHGVVLVSAGLWLAAVVVIVLAPFRLLYGVAAGSQLARQRFETDGWGRVELAGAGGPDQHAARYGVVLYAGVVLLLVAAVLCLRQQLRSRATGSTGTAVAFAGVGVIAGTVAAAWLDAQSVFDSVRANLSQESLDPSSRSLTVPPPVLDIGWCVWLGVLGVGCALLALAVPPVALWLAARSAARRPVPAPSQPTEHAGEDLLTTG